MVNNENQRKTFQLTDTKLHVPIGTLSTQENAKPLNPNLGGFFRVRFEVGVGGRKLPSCLKLVRIMIETSNLACKYTPIFSFRNIPFSA